MNDAQRNRKRFNRSHRQTVTLMMSKTGTGPLAVIRPLDPALAIRLVDEIPNGLPHEEASRRFNQILDAQPYRFIGLAEQPKQGQQPRILDPRTLKAIDQIKPGDSFVDHDQMQKYGQRIPDPS